MKKKFYISFFMLIILILSSCDKENSNKSAPNYSYGTITTSNTTNFCKLSFFDTKSNVLSEQIINNYSNVVGLKFCKAYVRDNYLYFLYEGLENTKLNDIVKVNLTIMKDEPLNLNRRNMTSFVFDDNIIYATSNFNYKTTIDSYNTETGEINSFEIDQLVFMDLYPMNGSLYAMPTSKDDMNLYQIDVKQKKLTKIMDMNRYASEDTPLNSCTYNNALYLSCDNKILKFSPQSKEVHEISLSSDNVYSMQLDNDNLYILCSTGMEDSLPSSVMITLDLKTEKEIQRDLLPVTATQFYLSGDDLYCVTADDTVCQFKKSNEEYNLVKKQKVATSDGEYTPILFYKPQ